MPVCKSTGIMTGIDLHFTGIVSWLDCNAGANPHNATAWTENQLVLIPTIRVCVMCQFPVVF